MSKSAYLVSLLLSPTAEAMNKKYVGSFHLKPAFLFVKYCHETPTKNCHVCAYLLININEASPRTGNMLVVFILNQLFGYKILSGNPDFYSKWWRAIIGDLGKLRKKLFIMVCIKIRFQ